MKFDRFFDEDQDGKLEIIDLIHLVMGGRSGWHCDIRHKALCRISRSLTLHAIHSIVVLEELEGASAAAWDNQQTTDEVWIMNKPWYNYVLLTRISSARRGSAR